MSVIETPPRDRLAINTQVVQFSEGVIRSAIELELARNGQVFFIHNRVESIESIAALIQKIVPNARIAIGHGQMNEKEMEQVMLDFIDYKYDVLVATTIIENGIDIPRANTIIINRADNYGLSQLYQLRGRVGRSNRRAYAYLLIPSELELTPIARRRLVGDPRIFRSRCGISARGARSRTSRRGKHSRRPAIGPSRRARVRSLHKNARAHDRRDSRRRDRGRDERFDQSRRRRFDPEGLHCGSQPAAADLQTHLVRGDSEEELLPIHAEIEDRYGRIPGSVENLFEYGRLRKSAEADARRLDRQNSRRSCDQVGRKRRESRPKN